MKSLHELRESLVVEHDTDARGPHVYSPGFSPPNILILKRKTVRSYSSTERVALYYNEKLQRYFSVPFSVGREDARDDVVGVSEEMITEEHKIGAPVSFKSSITDKILKGKVFKVGTDHLVVHVKGDNGRYGIHHTVKKSQLVRAETLDEGVGHYSILKTGTSDSGMTDDEVYDNDGNDGKTTHYNIYHKGNPVGELSHGHYYGQVTGHMHGKPLPDISGYKAFNRSGPQGNLHGFLKSQTGKKWASNLHKYTKEEVEAVNEISIPTATRAFHARQELGDQARSKKKYRATIYHYAKATKTLNLRAKKYQKADRGEVVESVELTEDAISHLQKVKAFSTDKPLYHKDGTQTKVDPQTANALLTVHGSMHSDNQKKFADALEHSKAKFHKMLDFTWSQVK